MDKKNKKIYKLKNGIKVLIIPLKTTLTHISINFLLGTNHETQNTIELTHFMEHLIGRMTSKKYPNDSYISREISKRGAYTNAYVNSYETTFYIEGFYKDLEFFIDLLSNAINDFQIDYKIAQKEKNAVIQELRNIISNNDYIFEYEIFKYLYPKYAYQNDYVKHINFIKNYDINKLYNFINKHILMRNMVISISCPNNKIKNTKQLINKYFGKMQDHNNRTINYPVYEHKNSIMKIIRIKNPNEDDNTLVNLYVCKPIKYLSDEHLTLIFLQKILFNFDTGIFYKVLRKELGLIYSIKLLVYIDINNPKSSCYYISTSTFHSHTSTLIKNILDILQTYSLTDEDIANAQNSIILEYQQQNFYNLTSYNKYYQKMMLHNQPIIEKSDILKTFKSLKKTIIRKYFEVMKTDIINNGIVFYYSNKNLSTSIKKILSNNYKYQLHTIEK